MLPGDKGQQELFSTVLRANEANKMGKASGGSLRTFMRIREKKKFWFLGCVTARNMAVMKVERINKNEKKIKMNKNKEDLKPRIANIRSQN